MLAEEAAALEDHGEWARAAAAAPALASDLTLRGMVARWWWPLGRKWEKAEMARERLSG